MTDDNNINASLVKKLRQRTGVGMMTCKKALIEAKGNIEKAIDHIRIMGVSASAKKSYPPSSAQGMILIKIQESFGSMVEINSETDFVSNNVHFKTFSNNVISTALSERITDIKILQSLFEQQRIALMTLLGERIHIRRLAFLEEKNIGYYIHGSRIGVMVTFTNDQKKELGKKIAMHITACKPAYIKPESIPMEVVQREQKIQQAILSQSTFPSIEISNKIFTGRMQKFITESSLTEQKFIFEPTKTVSEVLKENNTQVNNFIRFEVGEEI
ncbi:MAG: translation elongation factor Ts [Candidatus Dasytiphilus stammeri]